MPALRGSVDSPGLDQRHGAWGPSESGLSCRLMEVQPSSGSPYVVMQIRNRTGVDKYLANQLPMGAPSSHYRFQLQVKAGNRWFPVIRLPNAQVTQGGHLLLRSRLRIPAHGLVEARFSASEVLAVGKGRPPAVTDAKYAGDLRGSLIWFNGFEGYKKGNHRASCPPLRTRWVGSKRGRR